MTLRVRSAAAMLLLLLFMQAESFGQPRRRSASFSAPVYATRTVVRPAVQVVERSGAKVLSTKTEAAVVVPATAVSMQSAPGAPTPVASSCGCTGSSPSGACTTAPNCKFAVRPSAPTTKTVATPVNVTMPGPDDCVTAPIENIPFYKEKIDGKGKVKLPQKTVKCFELFKFKRVTYKLCGCEVDICVPCEIVCDTIEKCEPVETEIAIQARIRTQQSPGPVLADLWVTGVRGLPSEAVLALTISSVDANAQFGTSFSY